MVYDRRVPELGNEVEVAPGAEDLGLSPHQLRGGVAVGRDMAENDVGLVDDRIIGRKNALDVGLFGVEAEFIHVLEVEIVSPLCATGDEVVGKHVAAEHQVILQSCVGGVHRGISRKVLLIRLVVRVIVESSVLLDVKIVAAGSRHKDCGSERRH